MKSILSSKY